MEFSSQVIHAHLAVVDQQGWDSTAGRQLLEAVRTTVVQPLVRRSGLRSGAADQAESSGWAAGWDALRRPSARVAQNPGGMVWVAVRRAVWAEVTGGRGVDPRASGGTAAAMARHPAFLSLDAALQSGWEPADRGPDPEAVTFGPLLRDLIRELVAVGWRAEQVIDSMVGLADHARPDESGADRSPAGLRSGGLRCRVVAQQVGLPQWQVRRLAEVIVGGCQWPAVPALMRAHGNGVIGDAAVQQALRSTTRRWMATPGVLLADWSACPECAA